MTQHVDRVMAEALAERITSALVEGALAWGEAINEAAAAAEGTPQHKALEELARLKGLELAQLASGIAATLRPKKTV